MNVNQQPHPATRQPRRRAACLAATALAAALATVLAACSSVPLGSLWSLRKLDFWTLDPAQVHALALLPAGVDAQPEALRITLTAHRGGGSGDVLEEHLALRAAPGTEAARPAQAEPGAHWLPLGFDEADTRRFNAYRSRLLAWKTADGKVADRNFNVKVEPALCSSAAKAVETRGVKLSAWLRWLPGQDLLPVLDGAKLQDVAEEMKLAPRLPACG